MFSCNMTERFALLHRHNFKASGKILRYPRILTSRCPGGRGLYCVRGVASWHGTQGVDINLSNMIALAGKHKSASNTQKTPLLR